jgi:hypothetical protein
MAKRKKDERTNNIPQNDTHKKKPTQAPLNTGCELEHSRGIAVFKLIPIVSSNG